VVSLEDFNFPTVIPRFLESAANTPNSFIDRQSQGRDCASHKLSNDLKQ